MADGDNVRRKNRVVNASHFHTSGEVFVGVHSRSGGKSFHIEWSFLTELDDELMRGAYEYPLYRTAVPMVTA